MVWQQMVLICFFIFIAVTAAASDEKPGPVRATAVLIDVALIALVATI